MTPRLRTRARNIAAQINATGKPACVWILDKGKDLGSGPEFPRRIPHRKHVGCYSAPVAHGDIAEDVEHVLDELQCEVSGVGSAARAKKA